MRCGGWLVVLALAGCNDKRAAPKSEPRGSAAADPWEARDSSPGAPSWVNDPPNVMRDKIVGVNAHVVVLKSTATFAEYRDVLALAERTPGVVAAQPFVFREVDMAGARKAPSTVAVKAVDPARVGRVLTVGRHMTTGTIDSLGKNENAIILGDDLASQLGVGLGDDVKLTLTRMDGPPVTQSFRVTGLFHVAFDEYDERLAFVSLRAMQALVGRGDQVMGIEMIVKDLDRSAAIVNTLVQALGGPPYQVMDWYELNKQLFTALYGERRP